MPLSYPVDLNEKYTFFNTDTGSPLKDGKGRPKTHLPWPTTDGFLPPNLNPKIKILLEIQDPRPTDGVDYDSATQKVTRASVVYDTVAETSTYGWEIVALSQAELDAIADSADRSIKRTNVANAVDTLRTWATQAQGVTVTSGNAVSTLQTMVDRMGVFFDRFADLVEGQNFD